MRKIYVWYTMAFIDVSFDNGKTSIQSRLSKDAFPELEDKAVIKCPADTTMKHVTIMCNIIRGGSRITPGMPINSHKDLYIVLQICKACNVSQALICETFAGWVSYPQWLELENPEYMYMVYDCMEELVNYKRYFATIAHPFTHLVATINLPEMKTNPYLYMKMLTFYQDFKLETIFEGNNKKLQARIEKLKAQRNKLWECFLVDPYKQFLESYFTRVPNGYDVWSCSEISTRPPIEIGAATILPYQKAVARFHEFTMGLFLKSPNPNAGPFPFNNVVFAGGSICKIMLPNYDLSRAQQSDVDMFLFAQSAAENAKVLEKVLAYFDTPGTYYAIRGSVVSLYMKDIRRKFQIISINVGNPYEVIERFDLTHIQWCLMFEHGVEKFYGTVGACLAMQEQVTRFHNMNRARIQRVIKALHCGFDVRKTTDLIENNMDISAIIEKPKESMQLHKILRELNRWYYPTSTPGVDKLEDDMHIMSMIEQDSNASLVHTDIKFVLDNVTVSGSFENEYESVLYTTFNVNIVNPQRRPFGRLAVKSAHGTIRLTTCVFTVHEINLGDEGLDIKVKLTDENFREFIKILETSVFRLYAGAGRVVTTHIIDANDCLSFHMPRYKLERMNKLGISCLRSQRGTVLNIDEDLKAGDQIQILFMIEIDLNGRSRCVKLNPLKFIKYAKYDPSEIRDEQMDEENITREVEMLADKVEFDSEIIYDE